MSRRFVLLDRDGTINFEEDEEIACFEGADELVEKCHHYLPRADDRRRIALAGRRGCETSGYSETDRVREVLPLLEQVLALRRPAA